MMARQDSHAHEGSAACCTFGEKVADNREKLAPVCVGIDPHPELLSSWGLDRSVDGLEKFCAICVDAFGDVAAAIKPQVAFFEAYGSSGMAVLEKTLTLLKDSASLTIADAKRGDIGSTMQAYAAAWLEPDSPLSADAVTVSPYLGFGSLAPAVTLADKYGKGLFVLSATSNPEAAELQNSSTTASTTVAQYIVDEAASANASSGLEGKLGNIGVVVGATVSAPPVLSKLNGPVLLPGVGAQGATLSDVAAITQGVSRASLPSVSRAILSAGPNVSDLRESLHRFIG